MNGREATLVVRKVRVRGWNGPILLGTIYRDWIPGREAASNLSGLVNTRRGIKHDIGTPVTNLKTAAHLLPRFRNIPQRYASNIEGLVSITNELAGQVRLLEEGVFYDRNGNRFGSSMIAAMEPELFDALYETMLQEVPEERSERAENADVASVQYRAGVETAISMIPVNEIRGSLEELRKIVTDVDVNSLSGQSVQGGQQFQAVTSALDSLDRTIQSYEDYLSIRDAEGSLFTGSGVGLNDIVTDTKTKLGMADNGRVSYDNASPPQLRGNTGLITRALSEIIANGLGHGENVTVSSSSHNGNVIIDIENDGPAIPLGVQRTLFLPTTEGTSYRELAKAGMGLSIAEMIVRRHGGELSLTKSDDSGTSFRIVLPAG